MPPASTASTSVLNDDQQLHVLRRATYGPTPELLADIRARGTNAWLSEQLAPLSIGDSAMDAVVARFPLVNAAISTLNALAQPREASLQLQQCTIARQVWSKRQLFEVMVEFWSNHLNVLTPHPATYTLKPVEDRAVIRKHALGRFENLLVADARSPAMLHYLMNNESEAEDPNENYGRELLQLHTVTPSARYTETDVRDSALVLTGRSTDGKGTFVYKSELHYVGPVRVLGWSSANASASGGLAVGDSYLRYLARHEHTARNLSRKLAIRFVSDDPPQSLIDNLTEVWLDTGGAIVPWLRALFTSPEFTNSIGQKNRRPGEDVVASARALKFQPPTLPSNSPLVDLLNDCGRFGHAPLGWGPPNGYPDILDGWWSVGTTLGRCNVHRQFTRGYPTGLPRPPLRDLLAGPSMSTLGAVVDRLTDTLTAQRFRDDHRNALLAYAGWSASAPYDQRAVDKMLPDLTELVLNSAYRSLR
ncbi:MAG: DUF1800 domain-containing protein [Actinomycetota bacterium]|nr:DUF1800 domain-containing protein [Actinomycetota bacterium]